MDIFNKKKILKLEEEITELNNEIEKLKNDKLDLKMENAMQKAVNKSMTNLQKENEKLSKWIQGIIKILGTMEVKEIEQIHIPIVKYERNYRNANSEMFTERNVATVIIPEIRFSKTVFY